MVANDFKIAIILPLGKLKNYVIYPALCNK